MKRMDFLSWLSMLAAVAVSAHGEWTLGIVCGFHPAVAAGLPLALDTYALRALRAGREVLPAVLGMMATNAASHLVAADVVEAGWPLIAAVSSIAPLVLWRVHILAHRVAEDEQPAAVEEPVSVLLDDVDGSVYPEPVPTPYPVEEERVRLDFLPLPQWAPATVEEPARTRPVLAAEQPRTRTEVHVEYVPEDEPEAGTDDAEAELIARGRETFAQHVYDGKVPSIREIRAGLGVGQTRAQRVQDALRADVEQGVTA
ncbi:hypothetical protein BX265_4718 [Streptomyces sp. TLI_235]|nr:hypothetical protein [Streptomyces sp. TLI_235]PBC79889.1 hypothetical protein BX265_4718 [Streptomyces sp. TLI_235]